MLAGAPRRLLRLSAAGAAILDRIGAGEALESSPARSELVERLLDGGVLHPDPSSGEGGPDPSDVPRPADVTLVVPVRDRAAGLKALLESVLRADEQLASIVVVDDGSADPVEVPAAVDAARGTALPANADAGPSSSELIPVSVVRHDRPCGPAAARNSGLARVTTPLVAMVDSDCTVEAGWLAPLLALFTDPRVAIAAPRVRSSRGPRVRPSLGVEPQRGAGRGISSALAGYEAMSSPLDLGRRRSRVAPGTAISYVPSAALIARTEVLAEFGGFDERMTTGEDVDLAWRLIEQGHRIRYEPSSTVAHEPRTTLRTWATQRFGYGRSAAALDRRHPGRVSPIVLGRWSAAVWGLAALGAPASAAVVAAATSVAVARSMPDLPPRVAAGVALGGHLAAGRQLARASVREWWPITLGLAATSRRARRLLAIAAAASVLESWRSGTDRESPEISLLSFAALSILDGLAYGTGVWVGCFEQRSLRALLPRT